MAAAVVAVGTCRFPVGTKSGAACSPVRDAGGSSVASLLCPPLATVSAAPHDAVRPWPPCARRDGHAERYASLAPPSFLALPVISGTALSVGCDADCWAAGVAPANAGRRCTWTTCRGERWRATLARKNK